MTIQERLKKPTPRFFKRIRNIGLGLAAISTALITAPVALPLIVIKIAGYLAVAGGMATAVSQATTENESKAYGE
jgi:hypothetical protein